MTPARMHAFRVPGAVNVVHFWCADPLCRPTMPTPLSSEQAGHKDNIIHSLNRLLIASWDSAHGSSERACGSTLVSQLRGVDATPASRFAQSARESGDTPLAHPLDLISVGPEEVEATGIETTMPLERPCAGCECPSEVPPAAHDRAEDIFVKFCV